MAMLRSICMAKAYSNDLRQKFFQAYDEGEGTLEKVAGRFRVSLGWAKKISARRTRTGHSDAPPWRHGSVSRVTDSVSEWIREQIHRQPDMTLRELGERMAESQGVVLSRAHLGRVLCRLQLRLKKNRSTPRSKTPSKRSNGGKPGGRRSVRSKSSS